MKLKEDESGEAIELEVIHSQNRDDTYEAMKKIKLEVE